MSISIHFLSFLSTLPTLIVRAYCLHFIAELEVDTFKVLWDLSAPGSDAEGCLLRIHEEEYFADDSIPIKPFENMPDVRFLFRYPFPLSFISISH